MDHYLDVAQGHDGKCVDRVQEKDAHQSGHEVNEQNYFVVEILALQNHVRSKNQVHHV
jgi:hypothetical protein